jgi:adenylate cyclase
VSQTSAQRRLAAILVADVVGYSRLMEADETGTLAALRDRRKGVVEPLVRENGGRIVKFMGDGVLVEFASAVNALRCALDLQKRMEESSEKQPDRQIVLRIGVNLGEVVGEGTDIFGDGVNIAARLEGLAEPGGICISGKVHDEIRGKLDFAAADLGEVMLKNITRPVRAFRISAGAGTQSSPKPYPPADSRPSIAVLPFTNMSGDPEQEYFADGITEDIITELARNRGLFVIARNSSFTFKGTATNVGEVGRKLGVRYLVEGSVRKADQRVRITAQLIEAATGSHIWAERYDRDLEDIFAVQDEVTRSIVAAVPGHLESDIVKASRRKPTESLGAYDHYLRGMEIVNRWRHDDNPEAMAEFESAVRLDPNFARAHASLGHMHLRIWWQTIAPHALEKANTETELAVRLDGGDSRCLSIRGMYLLASKDYDGASDTFQRALQLSPEDPELNVRMAYYLVCTGQANEAIERSFKASRANPLFLPPSYQEAIGMAFMMTKRYEDAAKSFIAIRSPDYYIHVWAAGCLAKLGRIDEARAQSRLASELKPDWSSETWWGSEYTMKEDRAHDRELVRLAIQALGDET